jgi:RimJ/RimL family protein N-acetyltransferase
MIHRMAYLQTDRLVLRDFRPDDVDNLVALDADPGVMRYINNGVPTSREEIEGEVLPNWLAYYERGSAWGFWAAEDRTTGEFLGWFHLRPPPGEDVDDPEVGYRMRTAAWGQGSATEGTRRVMEKAGMRLIRTFRADWPVRIDGDQHGDVEYAITRQEWAASRT